MAKKFSFPWNIIVSVVTLAMLWSLSAQLKLLGESNVAFAQENPPAESESVSAEQAETEEHGQPEEEEGALEIIFHWFNFALILGGIGYLGKRYMVPFFDLRAKAIQQEMENSAQAMAEATQRLSHIEDKLQRLSEEIQELRRSSLEEAAAERARMEGIATADADKIVKTAEQEIAAAAKAARRELRIYTADLAIELAEKRIRETITPQAEKRIFRSFLEDLHGDSKQRSSNSSTAPSDSNLPPTRRGAH
ncbi:MAG: ATP synthase F0 subunit B [Acidobacteria bacterium]|nr:ATP synthase F0 subunit B [Acidobacteriota bacterium]